MNKIKDPKQMSIWDLGPDECWHLASVGNDMQGKDCLHHKLSSGDQQVSEILWAQGVSESVCECV